MSEQTLPQTKKIIDMSTFPRHTLLVLGDEDSDRALLDLPMTVSFLIGQVKQHPQYAKTKVAAQTQDATEAPIWGRRLVSLNELVVDGCVRIVCEGIATDLDINYVEGVLWNRHYELRPTPAPVDLSTFGKGDELMIDGTWYNMGKLAELINKKLTPRKQRNFEIGAVFSAEDRGMLSQKSFGTQDVTENRIFSVFGNEYNQEDVEQFVAQHPIALSAEMLPLAVVTHFIRKANAIRPKMRAWYNQHPSVYPLAITAAAVLAIAIMTWMLGNPAYDATVKLINVLQGYSPYTGYAHPTVGKILAGSSAKLDAGLISSAFMIVGAFFGSRRAMWNGWSGAAICGILGVIASCGIQLMLVIAVGVVLH